jgi:hypothetical protein
MPPAANNRNKACHRLIKSPGRFSTCVAVHCKGRAGPALRESRQPRICTAPRFSLSPGKPSAPSHLCCAAGASGHIQTGQNWTTKLRPSNFAMLWMPSSYEPACSRDLGVSEGPYLASDRPKRREHAAGGRQAIEKQQERDPNQCMPLTTVTAFSPSFCPPFAKVPPTKMAARRARTGASGTYNVMAIGRRHLVRIHLRHPLRQPVHVQLQAHAARQLGQHLSPVRKAAPVDLSFKVERARRTARTSTRTSTTAVLGGRREGHGAAQSLLGFPVPARPQY